MAYYDLYRNAPGWGTNAYQFISPQLPAYQPQSNWGGREYYCAQSGGLTDPMIYDYARGRASSFPGAGVGLDEARVWHRRAYGGLGDIQRMLPSDIGASAAYEVWRNWKHHYGVYGQPLADDHGRQREALIGLAVGEATRLWQYTGRPADTYGRLEAVEAAACTASRILTQSWTLDDGAAYGAYAGRLSRRASAASLHSLGRGHSLSRSRPVSPYLPERYDDGYAGSVYDDGYDGYPGAGAMMRRRSFSGIPGAYPAGGVMPAAQYATPVSSPYYGGGYAGSNAGYPGSYPATAMTQPYATQQPSVTVIQTPSSSSRHGHHRHRSSSRHRSGKHHHRSSLGSGGFYIANSVPYGY